MKSNMKRKIVDISVITLIALVLCVYAIVMIFPLVWGFLTSLKGPQDFGFPNRNVVGFPQEVVFTNYFDVWDYLGSLETHKSYWAGNVHISESYNRNFYEILCYTLLYTIGGSFIEAIAPAMMGYLIVKYPGKAANFINAMMLFVLTLPVIGNTSTTLLLLRNLNLYDSFLGNFIQKFHFTGMYFFVFQAFFRSVSDSYAEAAEIDGASQFRVMFGIYIPLAWKMISTVVLILFVTLWNDYQTPYLYLPTKPTLAYAVYRISQDSKMNSIPKKVAGCMMLALPILMVFLFLKEKIMGNISLGGEKE